MRLESETFGEDLQLRAQVLAAELSQLEREVLDRLLQCADQRAGRQPVACIGRREDDLATLVRFAVEVGEQQRDRDRGCSRFTLRQAALVGWLGGGAGLSARAAVAAADRHG
jgi:hypothetical protein